MSPFIESIILLLCIGSFVGIISGIIFKSCADDRYVHRHIISQEFSPDGKYRAVHFYLYSGGAVGWGEQFIHIIPRDEYIDPYNTYVERKYDFSIYGGATVEAQWVDSANFLVCYDETDPELAMTLNDDRNVAIKYRFVRDLRRTQQAHNKQNNVAGRKDQ